jgi:HAD superfamily hydrolase (TIGR01509 family)
MGFFIMLCIIEPGGLEAEVYVNESGRACLGLQGKSVSEKLEALLLDVDGTLADTERDGHRVAYNRAFAAAGLDWHWDLESYGKLLAVSGGKERMRFYLEQFNTGFEGAAELDGLVDRLYQLKTGFYLELMNEAAIPLRPGVERLLKEAHSSGLRLAIATTTGPENVAALLESSMGPESIAWFDVIAAGDAVPRKKPAPDIYLYALDKMGLPAAACLAIEDSDNGVAASTAAGLKTIVTVNEYTKNQDFSAAVIVLDQLGEPGAGFEVLAGDASGSTYVDIAFLNCIFRQ